jgi:hypothetical protein
MESRPRRARFVMSMRCALLFLLLAACENKAANAPKIEQPLVAPKPEKQAPPRPAQLTQVTIKALGMYCEESCPMKVRYALAEDPNVYELGFDVSNESIFVSYDAKLGTPKDVTKPMLAAIKTKAGFDPWLAKESWPDGASEKVQVVWR